MNNLDHNFSILHVVTHGRSGSTLTTALLNAIPGFQISGENHGFMLELFRAWNCLRKRDEMICGETDAFRRFGTFNEREFFQTAKSLLHRMLAPSVETRCVGFKEIRHTHVDIPEDAEFTEYLHFLLHLHPGTRFLFLTREVATASKSKWWAEMENAAEFLLMTQSRFTHFAQANPHLCFVLRYEDVLVRNERFNQLFQWIGVEIPDKEALDEVFAKRFAHW